MGLELPSELTEPLGWIGLTWPQADETKLFEDGQKWIAFGQALQGIEATADSAAQPVWTSSGSGDDQAVLDFEKWWTADDGPSRRLAEDAVAAQLVGAALIVFAGVTLAMKIAFIVQLVQLAIEVGQAIASAFATFGATTAEIPGFIAATRAICTRLVKQLVEHVQTVIKDLLEKAKNLFKKIADKRARREAERAAFDEKMMDDLAKVNPNFSTGDPRYTYNCTHCVQAYELRRRGLDVEAKALPDKYLANGGRNLSDIENTWGRKFTPGSKGDIDKAFSQPGSRGIVSIRWPNGGGHVFNVENVGGEVRYIDAQSGKMYVQNYFDQGVNTSYLRTDDLPLPNTGEYTRPRGS